jgi:hypothetical protein
MELRTGVPIVSPRAAQKWPGLWAHQIEDAGLVLPKVCDEKAHNPH